ncbi:MAG: hypothetical protein IPQ13_01165 [Holophagaceae bacterium]|nr:hypothetical protein [Holophagaceae bacterium]
MPTLRMPHGDRLRWLALCFLPILAGSLNAQGAGLGAQSVFNNGNVQAVENHPTRATLFRLDRPTRITKITTYHWNAGKGEPAGTVGLRSSTGERYGPWQVRVENRAYWVANPNAVLPAGTYTIEDSSPGTWAQNAASGGSGMAWIEGSATEAGIDTGQGVSGQLTPGRGFQKLALGDQVLIAIPPGAVRGPATLTIRPVADAPAAGWDSLTRGETYDISLGRGQSRPDRPLAMAFAYDASRLPAGADPRASVAAAYYDEASRAWVTVPGAVDMERKRILIRSGHLSRWTILYKKLGWETYTSRHFNLVHKPAEPIVYLALKKDAVVRADGFVKNLGEWLDQAYEAYEKAGFDLPGFELVPVNAVREARVVPKFTLPGFEGFPSALESLSVVRQKTPIWAFVGSATSYFGSTVVESQWDVYSGNILFAANFKNPEAARHDASHEFFHAVQNQYFNVASMGVRRWWMEATADYAAARLAMKITGKPPLMGADIKPRYLEKCITFHIAGDTGNNPHSFHDYSTSHFVDYLVSRGADFKAMWSAVANPSLGDLAQVVDPLDKYLQETFGKGRGLSSFYKDFARFYLFDPSSPLPLPSGQTLREKAGARTDTLAPKASLAYPFDLETAFTAKLWSIKPGWDAARPTRTVKVTALSRDAGVALYLYRLPHGQRQSGGGGGEGELGKEPRTLTLGQDDQLFILAVRTADGGKAGAEVKVEDLAGPVEKKPQPSTDARLRMDLQLVLYVSYTEGHKDDRQTWPRSGFQPFENMGAWRCFIIGEGGSFTGIRMDGDTESRVEGHRTADRIVDLKWKNHKIGKTNGVKYCEEWWEIELEDIPVNPSDPKEFIQEAFDFETGKYITGFEKHVPKLEHKITFYPSGKTIRLSEVFWQKSMVKKTKDLDGFGLLGERPFIRIYISNPEASR